MVSWQERRKENIISSHHQDSLSYSVSYCEPALVTLRQLYISYRKAKTSILYLCTGGSRFRSVSPMSYFWPNKMILPFLTTAQGRHVTCTQAWATNSFLNISKVAMDRRGDLTLNLFILQISKHTPEWQKALWACSKAVDCPHITSTVEPRYFVLFVLFIGVTF